MRRACAGMRFAGWKGLLRHLSTRALLVLALLALAGCEGLELPRLALPVVPTPAPTSAVFPTRAPTETAVNATAQPSEPAPSELVVWVPPQFDPLLETSAARLLSERVRAFEAANPGVRVTMRVKASGGPGGMLESLAASSAAAPQAVPALVALPRADVEVAAVKGLIQPLDGLTVLLDDADWYPYAKQLASLQGSLFGIPFGGDAMLLVYRPGRLGPAPENWDTILRMGQPLAFAAADPQGLFTLTLYQMLGGAVQDEQHRPQLQAEVLSEALNLYSTGIRQGVFPYWLGEIQTDEQARNAYRDQRAQWLVTWSSEYLEELPADSLPAALPTLGTQPLTLATGWVWALSGMDEERRALSVRLAEFLAEPEFLSAWTAASGMLPTRPSALAAWKDQNIRTILSSVALSAQVRPTMDIMTSIGPSLEIATTQVIRRESDARQAAQAAAERLMIPGNK